MEKRGSDTFCQKVLMPREVLYHNKLQQCRLQVIGCLCVVLNIEVGGSGDWSFQDTCTNRNVSCIGQTHVEASRVNHTLELSGSFEMVGPRLGTAWRTVSVWNCCSCDLSACGEGGSVKRALLRAPNDVKSCGLSIVRCRRSQAHRGSDRRFLCGVAAVLGAI